MGLFFYNSAARGIAAEILRGVSRGDWSEEPDPEPTIGGGGACHKNSLHYLKIYFSPEKYPVRIYLWTTMIRYSLLFLLLPKKKLHAMRSFFVTKNNPHVETKEVAYLKPCGDMAEVSYIITENASFHFLSNVRLG